MYGTRNYKLCKHGCTVSIQNKLCIYRSILPLNNFIPHNVNRFTHVWLLKRRTKIAIKNTTTKSARMNRHGENKLSQALTLTQRNETVGSFQYLFKI